MDPVDIIRHVVDHRSHYMELMCKPDVPTSQCGSVDAVIE